MTHSKIALSEKINQLINNNLENLRFSELFTLKKISQFRLIILLLLCCFSYQINCQSPQLSSRQAQTQSKAFTTKAEWFLKLPQYDLDSSYVYFQRAINCFKNSEVSNYQLLAEANLNLYKHLYKINMSPKVDACLKKARYFFNKIPNRKAEKLLAYDILIAEAEVSFSNGEIEKSNKLMLEGFSMIQENKSSNIQARYLLDKGNFYNRLREPSNGIKLSNTYLLASKHLFESSNDPQKSEMLFKVYARLGWYQNSYGTSDSCDYYFEKQKFLLPILNNPAITSYYSAMRANNYLRRKQYSAAAPLLLACQNISEKYKLTRNEVYVFNTYLQGVQELDFKQYDNAISIFNKGLSAAKLINRIGFINDGYERLLDAYTAKGDFKTALKYKTIWANATLGEYDKNVDKSLRESELKLNIIKKENELTQKSKERNWYIAALIAGLFLLVLVYRNFRLKQKSNQQLELLNGELETKNTLLDKRNAENELLLKEIHHRVKNNLEVVSSLLELQSAQIDDPAVQSAMLASQNRVHSMGIIHQKLYQGEHLAAIEMRDYFINLGENIVSSFNAEGRVKVECNMPQLVLDVDTAISIGLITNELLTNSMKYAFEEKENGNINITLNEEDTEGGLLLKVSDDGIGKVPDQKAKGTGFGTQLISLLTRQLDGRLIYENNNGTTVLLYFKKVKLT
jgi:two-component system, sensor histidine kinase PdtaS